MEPRVTMIVPCHNYSRYVGQALDSLLAQTFEPIEVIVIDDASTDDSVSVIRAYESDRRMRAVYHPSNRGHIATYNEGIGLARGEFIALLSADDYCLSNLAIERVVRMFDENSTVGLVYSAFAVAEGDTIGRYVRRGDSDSVRTGLEEFRDLMWGNYILHSGMFLRRSVQDELGFYDKDLTQAGDWDMCLRAMAAGHDAGYISEALWVYRIHGRNMQETGISPAEQIRQNSRVLERGIVGLPVNPPAEILNQIGAARRHAVLQTVYFDLSKRSRKRAWKGVFFAVSIRPSVLLGGEFYKAIARLMLVTVAGRRWRVDG